MVTSGVQPVNSMRVLHIDDNPDYLAITKMYLESFDPEMEVVSSFSPVDFLPLIENMEFDCVLCDYLMPEMDGIELCRRVRRTSDVPFIIHTGHGSEEVASVAFEAGADDYLRKEPGSGHFIVLAKRVRQAIEKHRVEGLYCRVLEHSVDGIVIVEGTKIVYANQALAELDGVSDPHELIGRDALDFVLAEDHVRLKSIALGRKRGECQPSKYEYSLLRPDGVVRRVEVSASPILYDGISATLGLIRDVTDRVRYENRLETLHEYVNSFSEAQTEEEIYTLTIEAMDKALGFEITDILMVDGEVLRQVAAKENNPKGIELRLDGLGNTVLSLRESRSIYVPDVEKNKNYAYALDPKTGEHYEGQPLSMSELCSPIILGGEAIGVLNVESTRRNAFTDEDIKILEIFARHVAHAIFRLRQENEIRASEEKYRTLMESSADSVLVMNGSTIVYANQKAAEIVGLSSPSELINRDSLDFIHPDEREVVKQNMIMRRKGEAAPTRYEMRLLHVDGSSVDVEVNVYLGDFEGKQATISFARDVSDKVRNRERLAALHNCTIRLASADSIEEIAKQTLDSIEEVFDFQFGDFSVLEAGRMIPVHFKGLTYEEFMILDLDGPGVIARAARTGESQLVPDTRVDEDYLPTFIDGTITSLSELAVPIKSNGNVIGMINLESPVLDGFSVDDQKLLELFSQYVASGIIRIRNEGLLKASEEKYRNILESSLDGITVTKDTKLIFVNPRFAEMLGYDDPSELLGRSSWDLVAPEFQVLIQDRGNKRREGDRSTFRYELNFVRKDGSSFYVEAQTSAIDFEGEAAVLGIHRDINDRMLLKEELRESEERHRTLIELSPQSIITFDREGFIRSANPAVEKLHGFSLNEVIGKHFTKLPHLDKGDLPPYQENFKSMIEGNVQPKYDYRFHHKDGTEKWAEANIGILSQGRNVGFLAVINDVTEHKLMEKNLRASEERYKSLFALSPFAIVISDMKGRITDVNDTVIRMAGFPRDELIGKHFSKLPMFSKREIPRYLKIFNYFLSGNPTGPLEISVHSRDGVPGILEMHVGFVEADGEKVGIQAVFKDVTIQKKIEYELRRSEEHYRSLIELAPDGIMTFNLKGEVTSINTAFMRLTGFSENEIVGQHFSKLKTVASLKDMPKYLKMFTAMLRGKTPFPIEFDYKRKDGTVGRCEAMSQIVEVEPEKKEALAILRDITDRKRMEEELRTHSERLEELVSERTSELRESEQRFRNVIDNLPMGVHMYEIDAKGDLRFVAVNPAADKMGAIHSSSYIGKTLDEVFPHVDEEIIERFKEVAEKGGFWHEEDICYEDDRIIDASDNYVFQTAPGEMASVFRDVTEQKRMEEALKASEAKYRSFLEEGLDGVVVTWNGEYLYVNQRYAEMLGYSDPSELLGRNTRELIDTRDAERLDAIIEQRQSGDMQRLIYEVRSLKKDGSSIWVEVASSGIEFEGKQAVITYARDITERKQMEEEIRSLARFPGESTNPVLRISEDGVIMYTNSAAESVLAEWKTKVGMKAPEEWIRYVSTALEEGMQDVEIKINDRILSMRLMPIEDAGYVHMYSRDVTNQKQMEESLLTAERLAVVGRISAMMGHDLRGPLVMIRNAVDLARKKPERTDKVLEMIERSAGQAMDLLEELRTRTREDPVSLAPVELGELLRKTTENILLPDGVELRLEIDDTLPELVLDEAKTIRVLDNIIRNAFDAMPAGGVLKIGATREGDKVVIRISDTGPGIPEDKLRNLFKPFYTTKPGGLGLGLTSAKRMMDIQGGTITVETSDGEGVTFAIVLPLKEKNQGQ